VHPALPVIFFTTLSGAGYGMLVWIGVMLVVHHPGALRGQGPPPLFWAVPLVIASLFIVAGLTSSMLHLGKPGRAWRAFSQWRTSWLSREGVMALVSFVPVIVLLGFMALAIARPAPEAVWRTAWFPASAIAMALCAVVTVVCTAMIYASLKTIPAWRQGLVVPGYLVFALLCGAALLGAMSALAGEMPERALRGFSNLVGTLAVLAALLKIAYWRAIDAQPLPATRGTAVGLPDREIGVFERPHTGENYITREMAFAIARRHSRRLRTIALLLFGVVPLIVAVAVRQLPSIAAVLFAIAAVGTLAGAFVERWLFFAEARHVVTLYY
jgi:DMSO reductase anchor subunit